MKDPNRPYGPDRSPEASRKVACQVEAIDAGIEVEPDTLDGEYNLSRQLAERPSLTDGLFPLTPNLGHYHTSAASVQAQSRMSATHILIQA